MKLSIVTTIYKSSDCIEEFYSKITKEANKISKNYEIIFVDDGSPDESLNKIVRLGEKDYHVKIIELSRNFGHHKAMITGLNHANGDYVFLIDSDLEEDPELLCKFWEELGASEQNYDMVYGVQKNRKGDLFERASGWLFYKIFNFLSEIKIPKNFLTVRLMKQNYVKNLINFKEKPIDRIYINAGIYIFSQSTLKNLKKETKKDAPEFFLDLKKMNKKIIIFPAHEEWKEIGTLENFEKFLKKNEKSNNYSS